MPSLGELKKNLRGLRVWVAGAAKSGTAAARLLAREGASVFVSDSGPLGETARATLTADGIPFEEGGHNAERFCAECQLLVLSPAIPLDRGLALLARRRQIPIVSEIELAGWFLGEQALLCAITGTNGKSTTTHYLGQLLALGKGRGIACGNVGYTFTEAVMENPNNAFAVELSSYQLETTYSLRPHVTILLNIQNDHQARYRNLDEYLKAKWRLLLMTRDTGVAIVEEGVLAHGLRLGLPLPHAEVVVVGELPKAPSPFLAIFQTVACASKSLPQALYGELATLPSEELTAHYQMSHAGFTMDNDQAISARLRRRTHESHLTVTIPCLPGRHNAFNLLTASLAGLFLGIPEELIQRQWDKKTTRYQHLPHRLEVVGRPGGPFRDDAGTVKRVTIINDSKATNVESVLVALRSFRQPIRLLLGGDPKGESYLPLALLEENPTVRFYPFGRAGTQIHAEIAPRIAQARLAAPCPSLFDAAALALREASDGDVVLLSPACASFDEFRNFEHRGDAFRDWAMRHVTGG
jgi:UDP-N-acetylmuramoylalanine--D-glutamate ligase